MQTEAEGASGGYTRGLYVLNQKVGSGKQLLIMSYKVVLRYETTGWEAFRVEPVAAEAPRRHDLRILKKSNAG